MTQPSNEAIKNVNESVEDLNELQEILKQKQWTGLERKGAERLLPLIQVMRSKINRAKPYSLSIIVDYKDNRQHLRGV